MKHATPNWYALPNVGKVKPFNGEDRGRGPSWSHGFTHYEREDGSVGFCGQQWFEANATEAKT